MFDKNCDFTSTEKYYILGLEDTDFDDLYKNYNESYKVVGKCFLDEVILRTAYNLNNKITDHKNLQFNAKYLLAKYGNYYAKAINKITSAIIFRTDYVVNEKCRSYYLNKSNLKKNVVLTSFILNTKGRNTIRKIKNLKSNRDIELKFLYKFFNHRDLKIDISTIYNKIGKDLEFTEEKAKNIIRLNNALQFHQGIYTLKYDKFKTKRLYSSFTMLKKEDRKLVTYKGEKLIEIDIKNSIPTLFSLLLTNSINIDYNNLFKNNIIYSNYILMFLKNAESLDIKEVEQFQKTCIEGVIYKELSNEYKRRIFDRLIFENDNDPFGVDFNVDIPKTTKLDFLAMLFSKEGTFINMEIEFEKQFPTIANFLFELKKEDYKYLSHILFSIESEIMINKIARQFNNENRGKIPLFTIHDCICTTEDNIEKLRNYMDKTLKSITSHKIKLTVG
jgi:hypothetical protein